MPQPPTDLERLLEPSGQFARSLAGPALVQEAKERHVLRRVACLRENIECLPKAQQSSLLAKEVERRVSERGGGRAHRNIDKMTFKSRRGPTLTAAASSRMNRSRSKVEILSSNNFAAERGVLRGKADQRGGGNRPSRRQGKNNSANPPLAPNATSSAKPPGTHVNRPWLASSLRRSRYEVSAATPHIAVLSSISPKYLAASPQSRSKSWPSGHSYHSVSGRHNSLRLRAARPVHPLQ